MHVFVTGATGFIGSALIPELLKAGHQVTGLARSDTSAKKLTDWGAEFIRGDLDDLESLKRGAVATEGVIHCAFKHIVGNYEDNCKADRLAVETLGAELVGTGKPFIITSGTGGLAPGRLATEQDRGNTSDPASIRLETEGIALAMAEKDVRVSVVRLPPSVHGHDDEGFIPMIIGTAHKHGVSSYIGDGLNRWPAVHRLDVVQLYKHALEKAPAGSRFHAIGDEGLQIKDIAEVIGRRLNMPVVSRTLEEARTHFGWFAYFLARDIPASSKWTQEQTGWRPSHPGLMEDLEGHYYFKEKPVNKYL
ncbi:MAG: hypothetical protein MMC33_007304 [Icmadophila ericetorum]|nr:hypothetical protein [Icmadophila ericetorum]